jgi:hypothetical protein
VHPHSALIEVMIPSPQKRSERPLHFILVARVAPILANPILVSGLDCRADAALRPSWTSQNEQKYIKNAKICIFVVWRLQQRQVPTRRDHQESFLISFGKTAFRMPARPERANEYDSDTSSGSDVTADFHMLDFKESEPTRNRARKIRSKRPAAATKRVYLQLMGDKYRCNLRSDATWEQLRDAVQGRLCLPNDRARVSKLRACRDGARICNGADIEDGEYIEVSHSQRLGRPFMCLCSLSTPKPHVCVRVIKIGGGGLCEPHLSSASLSCTQPPSNVPLVVHISFPSVRCRWTFEGRAPTPPSAKQRGSRCRPLWPQAENPPRERRW